MGGGLRPARVVVERGAGAAYASAGARAAGLLGVDVETHASAQPGALNVGGPDFARGLGEARPLLDAAPGDGRWDMICEGADGTWAVTGSSPLAAAHAALTAADWIRWDAAPGRPARLVRTPVFRSLASEFDDWSGGFHRMADGFDMERHVADMVRVGMTTLEINLLADETPPQVRERRVEADKYQWWCIYAPALDMFFETDLTRNIRPRDVIERNRSKLLATAALARKWGLTPTFVAFEPRNWPERLFDLWPDLRGARVDHPEYSAEPEYAMDPNHPLALAHYADMMGQLVEAVPDLGLFSVWSHDSAAGFPWCERLYPGPNGPVGARRRPIEETVCRFMSNLARAGRAKNPGLKLTLCASWFASGEIDRISQALPKDIGFSYTAWRDRLGEPVTAESWARVEALRGRGPDVDVQIEGISNPWKPLGPVLGAPFPFAACDMLRDSMERGRVRQMVFRGGVQSDAFVPNYINNEVVRAFLFEGEAFDVEALVRGRAQAWTGSAGEAEALVTAWRLADEAIRAHRVASWVVNFVSGRTLWRRLVKPLVPNPLLLRHEETRYYRPYEFTVGRTCPGWHDHFFKGWSRALNDKKAWESVRLHDERILPPLRRAVDALNGLKALSATTRDVRDRLDALLRVLTTDRNLMEVQEATHACLAENRERPERSGHGRRIEKAIRAEMKNVEGFVRLLEESPSTLIPVTSGEETPYLIKAPLSHALRLKLGIMARHVSDAPGPWFEELTQPGGWTSDLSSETPRAEA